MKTRSPAVLKWTHRVSAPQTSSGNKAHVQYLLRQLRKAHDAELAVGHIRYMQRGQAVPGALLATNISGGDAAVIAAVQEARSPVWRAVISLREEDAQLLGLQGIEEWHAAAHKAAERFREVLGIPPEGFCYAAAYHDPEPKNGVRHPHVHIDFWSTTYERPVWMKKSEFRSARRVVADLFHGPARDRVAKSRTEARDRMIEGVRAVVAANTLHDLAANMPGRGRIAYKYMPAHVKALVDEAVSAVLADARLTPLYQQYLDDTRTLTEVFTRQETSIKLALQRADADLRLRVANVILKMATDPDLHRQLTAQGAKEKSPESRSALPLGGESSHLLPTEVSRSEVSETSLLSPGPINPRSRGSGPALVTDPLSQTNGDRHDPHVLLSGVLPLVMAVARGLDGGVGADRRIADAARRRLRRPRKKHDDRDMM